MGTPGNAQTSSEKAGGFISKVINFVADKVYDIYIAGYFGSQYTSIVNVAKDEIL